MAINFPSNPSAGQTYSYNSITWTYNGTVGAWDKSTSGNGGATGATGATGAQGNTGAAGPSSSYYKYKINTTTTVPPADGQLRYDNASQSSATNLYISHKTTDNIDVDVFLALFKTNDQIIIQDESNSANYQKWTITGTPTITANLYATVPVNGFTYAGTGNTFANNTQVILIIFASPIATSYVSSFNGLTGAVTGVCSWNGQTGAVSFTNYVSTFNGSIGAVTGVGSFNGLTGDVTGVTTSVANTFTALQTFNSGIQSSGGTFTSNISCNSTNVGKAAVGTSNTQVSSTAFTSLTSGNFNTAFGDGCLANLQSGSQNAGNGFNALNGLTNGSQNTALGNAGLYFLKSGSGNVGVGYRAGGFVIGSNISQSIYIGALTLPSSNTAFNEIVIGYNQTGLGDNTTTIGTSSTTRAQINGYLDVPSGVSSGAGITVSGNVVATGALIGYQQINAQTGTSYTAALTDVSKLITLNNSSAITMTIPLNSSVNFPVGTVLYFAQIGAGQVGFTGASGVTVNYTPGRYLRTQYSTASAVQLSANNWLLSGDLTA